MIDVLVGGFLAAAGGFVATWWTARQQDKRHERERVARETEAIESAVLGLILSAGDLVARGMAVASRWKGGMPRDADDLAVPMEDVRLTSAALDRVRFVAPLDVQERAAELYDGAIDYFNALAVMTGSVDDVNAAAGVVHERKGALLEALGKPTL